MAHILYSSTLFIKLILCIECLHNESSTAKTMYVLMHKKIDLSSSIYLLICHLPLSPITHCLSFTIHNCLHFPIVCHCPLVFTAHFLSYLIVCSPSVYHCPLFIIHRCLSLSIICSSLLFHIFTK